jgi:hypothetical protein
LGIFALGSLIGKTTEVDMKFTREHGIVRARIDCANPQAIRGSLDHFYTGEGFGLQMFIEGLDGAVFLAGDYESDHRDAEKGGKKEEEGKDESAEKEGIDKEKHRTIKKSAVSV